MPESLKFRFVSMMNLLHNKVRRFDIIDYIFENDDRIEITRKMKEIMDTSEILQNERRRGEQIESGLQEIGELSAKFNDIKFSIEHSIEKINLTMGMIKSIENDRARIEKSNSLKMKSRIASNDKICKCRDENAFLSRENAVIINKIINLNKTIDTNKKVSKSSFIYNTAIKPLEIEIETLESKIEENAMKIRENDDYIASFDFDQSPSVSLETRKSIGDIEDEISNLMARSNDIVARINKKYNFINRIMPLHSKYWECRSRNENFDITDIYYVINTINHFNI